MHSPTQTSNAAHTRPSPRLTALLLSVSLALVGLIAAGCGGSSNSATTTSRSSTTHAATSTPASTSSPSTLAGKWSGQYSGAFNGTFTLNWTESSSKLSGKITLSSPRETTGISGAVSGSSIKFGTVSGAVYNGTVSGNSMSGNYETPRGGGSWSASRA